MPKSVCVIGAGISGLVSVKTCLENGLLPVCFEKDAEIGGLWNLRNPQTVPYCTITNTSKELSCLSDFPMPDDYPNFLPPDELMAYFRKYADNFGLLDHVKLNTEVVKIEKGGGDKGYWKVTTLEKGKTKKADYFDFLIFSTGFNRSPYIPETIEKLMKSFTGRVVHSSEYKNWKNFENENVVVSGFGNSSGDICAELSRHARKVYLSTKHGSYVMNRLMFSGYPYDAKLLRRLNGVVPLFLKNLSIKTLCNSFFDHTNYGLVPSKQESSAIITQVINDEVPTRIATGHISVKPEITSIKDKQVTFQDGTVVDNVDSLVCCSGYKRHFSCLENTDTFSFDSDGKSFPLYKYIFPVEHRGRVAFVGTTAVSGSVFPVYEMQARCAVQVFVDNVALPSEEEMTIGAKMEAERAKMIYGKERREAMRVPYTSYQDELAIMIGAKPNIRDLMLTDPVLAFYLYFGPSCPYQYRLFGPNSWSGARNAILTVDQRIWHPFCGGKAAGNRSMISLKLIIMILVIAFFIRYFMI